MILDNISRLPFYENQIPGAARIAAAFAAGDPSSCDVEIREKRYALKPDEKRRFEVHGRTIDLMMASEGEEIIHICSAEELEPAEVLPDGADGRKLNGSPRGTAVILREKYFCAIFPGEAHMVGGRIAGQEGILSKWVVKVPAPECFRTEDCI